jgi:hypothetical protein
MSGMGEALAPQFTSKSQRDERFSSTFRKRSVLDSPISNSLATRHAHLFIAAHIWGMVLLIASPAGRDVDYAGVWATYKS